MRILSLLAFFRAAPSILQGLVKIGSRTLTPFSAVLCKLSEQSSNGLLNTDNLKNLGDVDKSQIFSHCSTYDPYDGSLQAGKKQEGLNIQDWTEIEIIPKPCFVDNTSHTTTTSSNEALDNTFEGTRTFPGYSESGSFVNNVLHGKGEKTYASGYKYIGDFQHGQFDGLGTLTKQNNWIYVGEFKDGKRHGKGRQITINESTTEGDSQEAGTTKLSKNVLGVGGRLHSSGKCGVVYEGRYEKNSIVEGTITYPDGEVHNGTIVEKKLHGTGRKVCVDGSVQEGRFERGKLIKGKVSRKNGDVCEGKFSYGELQGIGKMTAWCGTVYEGRFDKGKLVEGKVIHRCGDVFEGTFSNRMLEGKGRMVASGGTVVEGTFVRDKLVNGTINSRDLQYYTPEQVSALEEEFSPYRNIESTLQGYAVRETTRGSVYEGMWVNGKPHGQGKLLCADGTRYHQGQFRKGKREGYGECIAVDTLKCIQRGTWVDDVMEGKGLIAFANGGSYEGNLKQGQFDGHGVLTFYDGSQYTGMFVAGQKSGNGTTTYTDGSVACGVFENGWLTGQGNMTYADGTVYSGTFVKGKLHGQGKTVNASAG